MSQTPMYTPPPGGSSTGGGGGGGGASSATLGNSSVYGGGASASATLAGSSTGAATAGGGGGGAVGANFAATAGGAYEDTSRAVQYACGDCDARVLLRRGDVIRCKECGHRVLYKERTNRMVQFEAR
ncbi:hypothetical protein BDY21DRAFT_361118 [Lineolata rhizophorae]|uniref:DNA directed RNA polymerase n=1 Tax=Lineolata rhizophorae TaxID=578093 RepID=A0A6A6PB04_9PEZI|nr:hypothetical protein BDY21DRAFT_361118 [Lineolata rhizophorae]